MGMFSWKTCDTNRSITNRYSAEGALAVQLLVPKLFENEYPNCFNGGILETDYEGYGVFGGHDAYELVADWNRDWIAANPTFTTVHGETANKQAWWPYYSDLSLSKTDAVAKAREDGVRFEWRYIGIRLACYDEDNAQLLFPIKFAEADSYLSYNDLPPAKNCPNQGFFSDDEEDDYF